MQDLIFFIWTLFTGQMYQLISVQTNVKTCSMFHILHLILYIAINKMPRSPPFITVFHSKQQSDIIVRIHLYGFLPRIVQVHIGVCKLIRFNFLFSLCKSILMFTTLYRCLPFFRKDQIGYLKKGIGCV